MFVIYKAYKKYSWFHVPTFSLLLFLLFWKAPSSDFFDFLYHDLFLPLNIGIITSIFFYILLVFKGELHKEDIIKNFLKKLIKINKSFDDNFTSFSFTKNELYRVCNQSQKILDPQNKIKIQIRNIHLLIDLLGQMSFIFNEVLKIGIENTIILELIFDLCHHPFFYLEKADFKLYYDELIQFEKSQFTSAPLSEEYITNNAIQADYTEYLEWYKDFKIKLNKLINEIQK